MVEERLVDDYVLNLLKRGKDEFGIYVDLENPTREQRLEIALAYDKFYGDPFVGVQIMTGRKFKDGSMFNSYSYLHIGRYEEDKERFYMGIPQLYNPWGEGTGLKQGLEEILEED